MIRATSTHTRWVVIGNVQYRFQALQFHSNVMEVFRSGQSMSFCEDYDPMRRKTGSTSSIESNRSRKASVVQIKPKDDTSDYHSDDDESSDETDNVFATVCYVVGCSIKKMTRLSVSDIQEEIAEDVEELLLAQDEIQDIPKRRRHSIAEVRDSSSINKEELMNRFRRRNSVWEIKPPGGFQLPQTVFEESKN